MDKQDEECPSSPDGHHVWARRRDGKRCAYCDKRKFGQDLTDAERQRLALWRETHGKSQ